MKYIRKGKEPKELAEFRMQPKAHYETMPKHIRDKVKKNLIEEQGYICCYCGGRIEFDENTSIEHFLSQKKFPGFELQYSNLHAVCDGGEQARKEMNRKSIKINSREKNREYPLYCDERKGDKTIRLSPLQKNVEQQFCFYSDGRIEEITSKAKEAIGKLHLNNKVLNTRRKYAIEFYTTKEFESHTQEQWKDEIKWLEKQDKEGKYLPFCFAVKRFIEDNML